MFVVSVIVIVLLTKSVVGDVAVFVVVIILVEIRADMVVVGVVFAGGILTVGPAKLLRVAFRSGRREA